MVASIEVFAVKNVWHFHDSQKLRFGVIEVNFGIDSFILNKGNIVKFRGQNFIGNGSKISFLVLFDLNLNLPDFAVQANSSVLFVEVTDDEGAVHALIRLKENV